MDKKDLEQIITSVKEVGSDVDWVRIHSGDIANKLDTIIGLLQELVDKDN